MMVLPLHSRIAIFQSAFINLSVGFCTPLLFPSSYGQLLTSFSLGILMTAIILTITKVFSRCLLPKTVVFLVSLGILGYAALAFGNANPIVVNSWFFILGAVAVSLEVFGRLFYAREKQEELRQAASAVATIFKSLGALGGYIIPGFFLTYSPNFTWWICVIVSGISLAIALGKKS
ncbi:hypothetical protein ACE1CD_00065 [Aerosakkonema sp. BLCC-F183]|uniref:hypothetical protein n=1 Tax=Aerosakkonema sp. BLCC-F183 TaxID=3342834 RepID=UPI0035B8ECBD